MNPTQSEIRWRQKLSSSSNLLEVFQREIHVLFSIHTESPRINSGQYSLVVILIAQFKWEHFVYLCITSGKMSGGLSVLATELLQYLLSSDEGYSDEQLKRHFGDRYTQLVPHVNELLMFNRLQLYNQGDSLYYKAIKEEAAAKFAGLG
jgi:hypothetical protein